MTDGEHVADCMGSLDCVWLLSLSVETCFILVLAVCSAPEHSITSGVEHMHIYEPTMEQQIPLVPDLNLMHNNSHATALTLQPLRVSLV